MTPRRVRHVEELDSIRGVALIVVALSHLFIIWPTWVFQRTFSSGGYVGVDLFFVLSGFLITALLLDEQIRTGRIRLAAFYWRRALRLVPGLWFLLGAHLVYAIAKNYPPFGNRGFEWQSIRYAVSFTMNWHVLWHPLAAADLTPIWSLAIEAQFYLVWPLVVVGLLGASRSRTAVTGVLLGLLALVTVWRFVVFHRYGWEAAYLRSDSHIDGLIMGSVIGSAWVRGWTPDRLPRWVFWAGAAVCAGMFTQLKADRQFAYAGGTTVFLLGGAAMVLGAVTNARPTLGPFGRCTAVVGRLSYGLYLWHFTVFYAVTRRLTGWSNVERFVVSAAVIMAGVLASRYLVELPALRLKRRKRAWEPRTIAVRADPGAGGRARPPGG